MKTRTRPMYRAIAETAVARGNCLQSGNQEWFDLHSAMLEELAGLLPSGSGLDSGTAIDADGSTAYMLRFTTAYHHMDEHGVYDGWTDHTITVRPSFLGLDIAISGEDRNDIKAYLIDLFADVLEQDVTDDETGAVYWNERSA